MKKLEKILIVDDSKLARLTLSRLLRQRNLDVLEASSVSEGLKVLHNEKVDAIFMDVMMPEKDGFEGLDLIKSDSKFKHIPCSMYSGDLSIESQKKAIDSGAQAYLFKPATAGAIERVLTALEANILTEDMKNLADGKTQEKAPDFAQTITTMDNRTRNLAKLIAHDRKSNENIQKMLERRINSAFDSINAPTEMPGECLREELERKRIDNELKAQLENFRGTLRLLVTLTVISFLVAAVAVFVAVFVATAS